MTRRELGNAVDALYRRVRMGERLKVSAEAQARLWAAYDATSDIWCAIYEGKKRRRGR